MNYFIYTSHHFTPHRRYELNELTSLPMCGFIAQLVEHCTGIAEVTGSNPVEALIFFRLLLSNCLNWKLYCDDHSSLWHVLYDGHKWLLTAVNKFTPLLWAVKGCCVVVLCSPQISTHLVVRRYQRYQIQIQELWRLTDEAKSI